MKIIKKLPGHSAVVDLVEVRGKYYVRKTMHPEELWNEKAFIETLKKHGLPCLSYHPHRLLGANQLLLTYIPGSPTIGDTTKPYDFFRIGKVLRRIHGITFPKPYRILEDGSEQHIQWGNFLQTMFVEAKGHQALPASVRTAVQDILAPLFSSIPSKNTLLHCDLHTNNMMDFNNSIAFFDKGSAVFAGDKLYDLGLLYFNFIHALYLPGTHQEETLAREFLRAFIEGYQEDPMQHHRQELERYMLLRAFERYPNTFEPYLEPLIKKLIERLH